MRLETVTNSPITRSELFYQQRKITQRKSWRRPFFYALMTLLAAFSVLVGIITLTTGLVDNPVVRLILMLYYILLVVLHFGLMLRTLFLASAAVTRDKRDSERWETLMLTGVTGREIVLGKWWATIKTMSRPYLFLALLRAAAVMTTVNIDGEFGAGSYFTYVPHTTLLNVLLGIATILILTMASLPFTAACGVMSAMDSKRGSGAARGLAARVAFTLFVALAPIIGWSFLSYSLLTNTNFITLEQYITVNNLISQFAGTLLDNGLRLGGDLIVGNTWLQTNWLLVTISCVLVLIFYALMTWALLWFAQWRAERAGALKSSEQGLAKRTPSKF